MTMLFGKWSFLLVVLMLVSCTQGIAKDREPSRNLSKKEQESQKISEARMLHERGEIDAAVSVLQTWVDTTPYVQVHDQAFELIVEWLLELNRHDEAKRVASFFLSRYQKSPSASRIIKLFDHVTTNPEKALETRPSEPEPLEDKAGGENPMDSVLDKEQTSFVPGSVKNENDKDYILFSAPVSEALSVAELNGGNASRAHARLATHYFHLGDLENSYHHIGRARDVPEDVAQSLAVLKQEIDTLRTIDFKSFGVILPLSGSFAPFGKKALVAMGLALAKPLEVTQGITTITKDGIRIVIADSKGDGKETEKVLHQLVKVHKVSMIVGDITNESSLLLAQRCEQYEVPLLSLSRHPSVAQMGQYIFMVNASLSQQVERLVDHAMKVEGHRRFAILFPRHNYGMSMSRMFFDEVIKKGGSITGIEAYDVHETTFASPVKKLVGKYYMGLRKEAQACTMAGKAGENCRNSIPPIVDFDALFIPEFQKLALVIPALLQEDLLISKNPRMKASLSAATKIENPPYIQLLGTNSWNDKAVLDKIAPHIEGAYFVDSFSFNENDAFKQFVTAFTNLNGQAPSTLEVFAHAAVLFAYKLTTAQDAPTTRRQLRDRIAAFKGAMGLLHSMSFLKSGELDAPEAGFQITNGVAEPSKQPLSERI